MFRKKFLKKKTWSLAESTKVIEPVSRTIPEKASDGTPCERVVYTPMDFTSKDAVKTLPTAQEYSLENLLSAGVPLEQLSVSTFFNPTDYATNQRLAENMIETINVESK